MFEVGDRVKLVSMGPDPNPIEPGATGTITFVTHMTKETQIGVDWDNGRRLHILLPQDKIVKI